MGLIDNTSAKRVTKQEVEKWDRIATALQFGSIFALFPTMFILEAMDKPTARWAVWFFVVPIFIVGTAGFIVSSIASKKTQAYLKGRWEEITKP
jgi:uncharacterized membrane protein (DUF4010 family)